MFKKLLMAAALATAALTPGHAATLTVAIDSAVTTLDPHATRSVGSDLSFLGHIFDTLTQRSPEGEIVSGVATSWTLVDPTTWRFRLRDDVTFPSGSVADAELVKWNIDRIINPENALRARSAFGIISETKVISPTEIEIRTKQPYPILANEFAALHLLDPAWVADHPAVAQPSGSGPYELVSFRSGDAGVLRLRKDYWGDKVPAFDEVVFRTIPDRASQLAALQAGEVDVITGFPPKEIERINAGSAAKALSKTSTRTLFVKLNLEGGPIGESRELRQALNYAIDKQALVDAFYDGHSEVLKGQIVSSLYDGFNPDLVPYPYDPAKARELIAASGIPAEQLNFEFTVATDVYLSAVDIVQVIAAQLEEVGIRTTINRLDFAASQIRHVTEHAMSPLLYMSYASGTLEASALYRLFETGNPYSYVSDARFDELYALTQSEFDPAKRQEHYAELSQHFRELAPVLFLFTLPATAAHSKKVTWSPRSDEIINAFDFTPVE